MHRLPPLRPPHCTCTANTPIELNSANGPRVAPWTPFVKCSVVFSTPFLYSISLLLRRVVGGRDILVATFSDAKDWAIQTDVPAVHPPLVSSLRHFFPPVFGASSCVGLATTLRAGSASPQRIRVTGGGGGGGGGYPLWICRLHPWIARWVRAFVVSSAQYCFVVDFFF